MPFRPNHARLIRRQMAPPSTLFHAVVLLALRAPKMTIGFIVGRRVSCAPIMWRAVWQGLIRDVRWSDDPNQLSKAD
jgi:hypothetical protein